MSKANLAHNLSVFRNLLTPKTKMMVMVKAYGYGLGPKGLSKFLAEQGVDYLGVANILEGVEIRKAGVKLPIAVMKPELESFDLMSFYQLTPVIFSIKSLVTFINHISTITKANTFYIHLKLDTGMHRLGLKKQELNEAISIIKQQPSVVIESIFSQLSSSDNPAEDEFSQKQIQDFEEMANTISVSFPYIIAKHIANSNAIARFPKAHFDMVRLGIGLLGFSENPAIDGQLKNVATLKIKIAQIHHLEAGETVGYGRMGKVNKSAKIATIPIGYADGLNRLLGNGNCTFLVNGKQAPTIGNICMDITMIDVTDIDCSEEDAVVLFYSKESVKKLSNLLKTIPYEIFTTISPRVKRDFI